MKTPYQILDVAIDADNAEIKQAYLKKVKECPPDQDQQAFQLVHKAYTSIKDKKSRMRYGLFALPVADFDGLIDHALQTERAIDIKPKIFNKLLNASLEDLNFLSTLAVPKNHE